MITMQKASKNGKLLRNTCKLLYNTGRRISVIAGTGYKAGYFMAKHPNIESTKNQIFKNYKAGLITIAGITIGILGFLMMKKS